MRAMRRWVCVLGWLLACGDDDSSIDAGRDVGADVALDAPSDAPVDAPPDAGPQTPAERLERYGEHRVGYRELTVTYDRPDGEGARSLELLVWYPTDTTTGTPPRYTLRPRNNYAFVDAPIAAGSYPVMVFSHGHQALPEAATFLMEHFASHGFLVLAPTHTGNTTADGDNRTTSIYYLRPHDVMASLDFVLAHEELGAIAGTPRIISGHSFGGYTAYALAGASYDTAAIEAGCADESFGAVCSDLDADALALFDAGFEDDRFDLLIAMASGDERLFGAGIADVDIPVFQMVAEGDGHPAGSAESDLYWTTTTGAEDLRFDLLGGAHNSFSDVCETFPSFLRCTETLDPADEQRWIRRYSLAFALSRLMDDTDAEAVLAETPPAPVEITRR